MYFSKDMIPIVMHGDEDGLLEFEKPEEGIFKTMNAHDLALEQLKLLDIGEGEHVPTLEETL